MWQYDDYLAISEDFIPVFSEEVDKNHRGNWKFFVPHQHMKNMLEKFISALERASSGDKRSMWLTGAYGTGKTFALFVIKHLLEDSPDEIEDYFLKHQILTPLWPRFKALREHNNYLVVYRSASGHITTSRRLMVEVQQAIKQQLLAKGCQDALTGGILEQMVAKLSETSGIFNWESAFVKHRGRFRTAASAEEVLQRLRAGDAKTGEQVAAVLEEEGLTLVDSPSDVKGWIKQVIAANNLQGIIFLWDEFTEFFANGVPVTPLQELAQATEDLPFYLFLVTHRALNQFTRIDEETRKKLLDRFHNCQLEMTPITAYRLIANVIEALPQRQEEWEAKRDSLWSKVDVAVLHINVLGERVSKDELKALAPIHPYTAYLLATISSLYSSSQRTLFQFLKKNEPGSFQWFIANYPKDDWFWLTPDYLWLYFFENNKIDSPESVNDILAHFNSSKSKLSLEQERVFRVMLLLTALRRETQGAHELLKPNLSVLKRMFVGTDLQNRVDDVARSISELGIMHAVSSGNDFEYIIPTLTIDQTKLQHYRQRAENSLTFERMIDVGRDDAEFVGELKNLLSLQGASRLRHPVTIVSAKEFRQRRESAVRGVEQPFEIGMLLVLAQEDGHLNDLDLLSEELSRSHGDYCIVVSQASFGAKRWQEWLDNRARSWYHEEMKDGASKKYYDGKCKTLLLEWINSLRVTRLQAFFRGKREELSGFEPIPGYLEDIAEQVFPNGPEKLSKVSTLYTSAWGKAGAEIGLRVSAVVQRPYKDVVDELKRQGIWDDISSTRFANHPLVKMKDLVDSHFSAKDQVNLKQLWGALQQPPYGLLPSPIGILVFAALLRSYSQGYYYSDGVNSFPLNPNKMAELIEQVMKGIRSSENYTVRKMSDQGELFCRLVQDIFSLPVDQTPYPEEARKAMRSRVSHLGYPIWAITHYATKALPTVDSAHIQKATAVLDDLLAFDHGELGDEQLKMVIETVHSTRRVLRDCLSRDKMQEGMRQFWTTSAPELATAAASLRLDPSQVMARLRALLREEVYLWSETRVKEILPDVAGELCLIDVLNGLMGIKKQDLSEQKEYFRTTWFKSKYPLACFAQGQPKETAEAVRLLCDVVYHAAPVPSIERTRSLCGLTSHLQSLLKDNSAVTALLVKEYFGQTLNVDEATQTYASLPELSGSSLDDVKKALSNGLMQQARQKKLGELQRTWSNFTGTESPESWSESMLTPIQWVLEGPEFSSFFARYSNRSRLNEEELDEMLTFIAEHEADFTGLQNQERVLDAFLRVAGGDYVDLIRAAGAADQLRNHIFNTMGGAVYQWPMRLSEVYRVVKAWITQNYRDTAYPRLVNIIEAMSHDDLKSFVRRLVADDVLVATRLLSNLTTEAVRGRLGDES